MFRATVVDVTGDPGRVFVRIPKLFGDSVLRVQSSVVVSPGDRVVVADLSGKSHARDWWLVAHESQIGMLFPPASHEHSQGDVAGLVDRLAAIEQRLTDGGL